MLPAWVTTADDAQVATSAHVRDLADSLATALASVQHEVDNPVLGAHCNCKVEEGLSLTADLNNCFIARSHSVLEAGGIAHVP